MKKRIAYVLIICILMTLCGCGLMPTQDETQASVPTQEAVANQGPVTVEGPGFANPEEAILAYAQALQKGDVQEILSTFAIETYVENFDLQAMLENNGAYTVAGPQPIPSADAYTLELNRIVRQYNISKNLTYMYMTLGKVENFTMPITFNGDPYDKPSELVDDLVIYNWMDMLAKMQIGDVLRCEDIGLDSAQVARGLDNQIKYLNCEELITLAVELTIDGEEYYLCVDVACYDGKWYNCNPLGVIGLFLGADALSGGLYPLEG